METNRLVKKLVFNVNRTGSPKEDVGNQSETKLKGYHGCVRVYLMLTGVVHGHLPLTMSKTTKGNCIASHSRIILMVRVQR